MELNSQTLETILTSFEVPRAAYRSTPLTQGLINDSFALILDNKPRYVLQRINNEVFKDVPGLMDNLSRSLELLSSRDYSSLELITTLDGQSYLNHGASGYWRLMSFLPESVAFNRTDDPVLAYEAGKVIAEFHRLLSQVNLTSFSDTLPRFHDLEYRNTQFLASLEGAKKQRIDLAGKPIAFAHSLFQKLQKYDFGYLPQRLCHNDTKLNNILFSKKSKKGLCLVDLDTLMKGYFLYDFGDTVRTLANTGSEEESTLSNISFDRSQFKHFIDGLGHRGPFLERAELLSLAVGAAYMPFIHGLRALTDFLNNDRYYKVSYTLQNLNRCKSLFRFTECVLQEEAYMKTTIAANLGSID